MALDKLDHVNIRTRRLDEQIAFYRDVLGLPSGKRPPFPFPGAWMYAGDQAVVHLVGIQEEPAPWRPDQSLEHFALSGTGLLPFLGRLRDSKVAYECRIVPGVGIVQVNVHDVDGNHIHIDFPPEEKPDVMVWAP